MDEQPLVAIVEDEEHLAQGLIFNLEADGYRTHHEADGDSALAWLLKACAPDSPDLPAAILLDVMLPGRDGFSVVRALREIGIYTPVLLLTARGRSEDVVEGFAAGADDYLTKPFDLSVLFARLSSLLRRMHWHSTSPRETIDDSAPSDQALQSNYQLAGRTIDLDALEIRHDDKTVHLTLMETDLLRYLLDHPERIIARKELLENVWHVKEDTDTRAIDNFIVRLRRYLEPDPSKPIHLLTVRGVGYRFIPAP
jgi:DNA-binding response OmpR family regulator